MSREFYIGAMCLTPYFLRRERDTYVFRDMPIEILRSLVSLSISEGDKSIAVYINPKVYFSTRLFTNALHPRGLLLMAYYLGTRHAFLVLSPKAAETPYWAWQRGL